MASKSNLLAFTTGLALCALHCSADDTALPNSTSGSSNNGAGQSNARGGTAGSVTGTAGSPAGTASSGGSAGLGAGGAIGGASTGGSLSGGAGSGGSSGTVSAGAGAGGVGTAGAAGSGVSGSGIGAGSVSNLGGAGGMSVAGASTSGGSGSGMAGSGVAGAPSQFAPVADIIGLSCATSKCHPNDKGVHADLHNTDGKLYERLLATGATIPMAKDACKNLPLVVPGSPQTSLIMAMIVADDTNRSECGDRMPYKCPDQMAMTVCLTDPQIETIRSWIAAGALP